MRIRNLIPTGGAHTPPGGRNAGRSSRNGSPNLRLELGHQLEPTPLRTTEAGSCHLTEQAACHLNSLTHSHFCLWIWSTRHGYPPRKAGRFTGADFPLQPDGTQKSPSRPCASPPGAAKSALTGACAWCMREVTVTAALAHCANSVNGRATRRASQSPRECEARIRCRWVLHRCGFALLPPPSPSASLYAVGA